MTPRSDGWDESAAAWLTAIGKHGDYGRRFVLDGPMLERIEGRDYATALDVGCGEGRFCRMMQALGIATVGIDPTKALVDHARQLDPNGDYRVMFAETLDVAPGTFDLVVCYLSLVDISDLAEATKGIARALRAGGTLLIANLTSFNTAGMPDGWIIDDGGQKRFCIDYYLEERAVWVTWHGIRIRNWHRPLGTYMETFLSNAFELRHFSEPKPVGGDAAMADHYCRVPYFHVMEWQKRRG